MIYLDNAATTAPLPEVLAAMDQMNKELYGNPSSLHLQGVYAEEKVEQARCAVAAAIGAKADEIYFGSGGTFCNNAAILGGAGARKRRGDKVVISAIEHACVREAAKSLLSEGFRVEEVEPTVEGFAEAIDDKTVLVSCMLVNNETGLLLPVEQIAALIRRSGAPALFHVDGVQALGKVKINVKKLGCDLLTLSSHKIHGPKGCGALFVKNGVRLQPIVYGGGQEKNLISGTHNTPGIVGFGKAAELVTEQWEQRQAKLQELSSYFLKQAATKDYLAVNRDSRPHAPHIINVSFLGYVGENVLHALESEGVYVSVGAACSNNSGHGSILDKMHAHRLHVAGAIRVSFSHTNTIDDIDAFFASADRAVATLIKKYK